MEKKGEIFNQMAIISDLIEKANLFSNNQTVIYELNKKEFERVYDLVTKKTRMSGGTPKETFNIKIGQVNFIFNMSNV